ncbi:MAG: ABC transporter substrate-binding protein [Pseudomonadota bacterium]
MTITRFFISLLLLVTILAGCADPRHDSLRFALASAPVTLDPRFATDATSARINRLLYHSLVDFDASLQPVPELAAWQEITPTHYRFTLRQEARFHDGSMLSSADVRATYASILDPQTASPHRASIALIERIATPDEHTVDFFLAKPDPLFPGYLVIGILPEEQLVARHPFNTQPVGSGAFRFIAWPEQGRLELERQADKQRLEFLLVKDPTVRALKLLRGEIDMLQNDMPPELVGHLAEQGMTVLRARGSNFSYLGFNLDDPITGQLPVRQAIAHAVNRDEIIRYVFGGAARPAGAILPPTHWAGNPDLPLYEYNPDKARTLLNSVPPERRVISYKTSSDPFRIRLATIIQQQLKEVGLEVKVQSYDWGTFYGDIKRGAFQMFSLSWVGIKTPDIFRYVFHSTMLPPEGANRGRYRSAESDTLIERAEGAATLEERVQAYRALQAQVNADLPYVPLWYEDHVFVARPGIVDYAVTADGNYDGLLRARRGG